VPPSILPGARGAIGRNPMTKYGINAVHSFSERGKSKNRKKARPPKNKTGFKKRKK